MGSAKGVDTDLGWYVAVRDQAVTCARGEARKPDRRFFEHPGVDPIGIVRAAVTNLRGNKPYLVGGSTLTQQIVKNTFLTPAKTPIRKLREQLKPMLDAAE